MIRNRIIAIAITLATIAPILAAQTPEIAVGPWVGLLANTVGAGPCGANNCATYNLDLNTVPPGVVNLDVYGEAGMPFFLVASPTANQCLAIPGAANTLMLDGPFFILASGTMPALPGGPSTCSNGTPPGMFQLPIQIPAGFCTPNFEIHVQALVYDLGAPSFTCTIRAFC